MFAGRIVHAELSSFAKSREELKVTMIHTISLGAGVQSSTLALMAASGEVEPMPDAAIFADTQAEPQSVYTWLDWLEQQLPFPVHRVTVGNLEEYALKMKVTKDGRRFSTTAVPVFTKNEDGTIGRITHRTCTRDFKIVPLIRKCRHLAGRQAMTEWRRRHKADLDQWRAYKAYLAATAKAEKDAKTAMPLFTGEQIVPAPPYMPYPSEAWRSMQEDALVSQWIGISMDEIRRMKPSRDPWLKSRHPLIEKRMTRQSCLEWMADNGYPEPPRSACWFCPFHGPEQWIRLRDNEPDEWQKAIAFERTLQERKAQSANFKTVPYLTRYCIPLDQIDFMQSEVVSPGTLWQDECEGMCGV